MTEFAVRLRSGEDEWERMRIDPVVLRAARTALLRAFMASWCNERHVRGRATKAEAGASEVGWESEAEGGAS